MRRIATVAIAIAAVLAACGVGTSFPDEVIAAEATWLCDLPRFAYDDASAIEAELDQILTQAAVPRSTYDEFKSQLDERPELRARVAASFAEICREA